ncbi:MAG: hypothetical protein GTN86_12610 [Xanthomonadales bacterium]|uniref:hypothetical protein n=1 Tax=Hydrogenophaga sp. TaxID=1904254 RepID=UPI001699F420|nr:hypothetical protein [Hydrogenophaga sp.]NIQ36734.1 hypothetical protein [Xanthomonadales bacterium]NIM42002.1 hypothetical protein [Hydrogenophaga sp.]NIN27305.1 hypothetical protein [Hydrogenophaga sp.]NIN32006.1 hypothetical protein [Hydrogenophaga sp.]NIN56158.1 hypothetical protein [Hydrogenophaga sp.]
MAEDVTIPGGKYTITIKDALSEANDDITGDKANIMNMALARGCWFQWEYSVQIELHTGEVEDDLAELQEMRDLYAEVADWTPQMLNAPANLADSLNALVRWAAGSGLINQATGATINGVAGAFDWPPYTYWTYGTLQLPFGTWEELQTTPFTPGSTFIGQSSDGVYFRISPTGAPVRVEAEDIQLVFDNPIVASDADIAKARRELEAAIESKTQRNQEKQAQLQDLTAALQRWFTFTTNVNERKKRDADTIAGNFH